MEKLPPLIFTGDTLAALRYRIECCDKNLPGIIMDTDGSVLYVNRYGVIQDQKALKLEEEEFRLISELLKKQVAKRQLEMKWSPK